MKKIELTRKQAEKILSQKQKAEDERRKRMEMQLSQDNSIDRLKE
jgi:hypothetical protein